MPFGGNKSASCLPTGPSSTLSPVGAMICAWAVNVSAGAFWSQPFNVPFLVVALAAWSAMTALCGLAHNRLQLTLARFGVGIGEAGGTPPSTSILADKFPAERRPMALTIFALGACLGAWLGSSVAGTAAERGGWRAVAVLRLIPIVPHSVANYGLGLTRLSLGAYAVGSFLGQLPLTIAYADFGAAGERLMLGGANWVEPTLIGLAGLSLSLLIPAIARRSAP